MLDACPRHADDIRTIQDTFTGADGGVSFYKLVRFLAQVELEDEERGTPGLRDLACIRQFATLIKAVEKAPFADRGVKD